MSPMAEQILKLVKSRSSVSFVELTNQIEGFRGNLEISMPDRPDLVLWSSISNEAVDAIHELQKAKEIHPRPTSVLVYLCDGGGLRLPIAHRIRRPYKKPHWLPIVFNPGPMPEEGEE